MTRIETDLYRRLLEEAAALAGEAWPAVRHELEIHLKSLALVAARTMEELRAGRMSLADADFALHAQELYLSNVLRHARVLGYVTAQKMLAGVFTVLGVAMEVATGVELVIGGRTPAE